MRPQCRRPQLHSKPRVHTLTDVGTLYIVPTPIGNLEDITLRALRILQEASLIAAEDTRTTGRLLAHYDINTPQISYHEHNELARLDTILDALASGDVALVSDAGTPGISDPGYRLIKAAIDQGVTVAPLPGASATLTALVASGLPTDSFVFLGFLPRKAKAQATLFEKISAYPHTLIFYESPHRLVSSLEQVSHALGERQVVVCRELTKLYEEFVRGSTSEVLAHFREQSPRGEIVLLIEGATMLESEEWDEAQILAALQAALDDGMSRSAAAKHVAQLSGWAKSDIYNLDV